MRGRPKRYENQADKQKAYRERQKADQAALRNSPVDENSLEYWQRIVQETHNYHVKLTDGNPMLRCARGEFEYVWWTREVDKNHNRWWEASQKVFALKRANR